MAGSKNGMEAGDCATCGEKLRRTHCTYVCHNCGYSADYSDL